MAPTVAEPLSRRDLLIAAAEAASDYSAGVDDAERQRSLDGRPFSFALRFCTGDADSALFKSALDEDERVLRLEVRPDLDAKALAGSGIDSSLYEAVEGFWVRRPWLLDSACPAPEPVIEKAMPAAAPETMAATAEPESVPAQPPRTVGLAHFFDDTSSRSRRRGDRPYGITRKLPQGQRPGPVDLLIEGRVRALPGGRTIVCSGRSPTASPTCIISVRIDQVSLRQPGGETLATWGPA